METFGRPVAASPGADVKVKRTDYEELGVVLHGLAAGVDELVTVNQVRYAQLGLEGGEGVSDATAGPGGEGRVGHTVAARLVAAVEPAIRVEAARVFPLVRTFVQRRERRNHDGPGRHQPAARQDDICFDVACRLERWVMHAVRFFDETIEEGQRCHDIVVPRLIRRWRVVHQLLQQSLLVAGVMRKGIKQPREQRGAGDKARADQRHRVRQPVFFGQFISFFVDGPPQVVGHARRPHRRLMHRQVGSAVLGNRRFVHGALDKREDALAHFPDAPVLPKRQIAIPSWLQ
ncbi:hypothetical protein PgNI_06637 [Pyricularia grisea]|uniref:Uncharacterized protein n=1 Tax=Pyricularia grisea TaxID=148305 RepID=A0A6P8B3X4_PYRGI|nr:hypothetical protein PgNI_06637 [Pyricularia grisea]TLD09978.1 hypothetical protein PgNI_06637 [Pyricularia grisea]